MVEGCRFEAVVAQLYQLEWWCGNGGLWKPKTRYYQSGFELNIRGAKSALWAAVTNGRVGATYIQRRALYLIRTSYAGFLVRFAIVVELS